MWRLIGKMLLIIALVVITLILVLFFHPRPAMNYVAAALDKQARLKSLESPKMVIVGGSGAACRVDGALLQETYGYPVVNMGITAALGLDFMLNQVAPYVHPGDVVLLVLEYDHYTGEAKAIKELSDTVLLDPAEFLPYTLTYEQQVVVWQHFSRTLREWSSFYWKLGQNDFCRDPEQLYCRDSFNEVGDMVIHLGLDNKPERVGLPPDDGVPLSVASVHKLNHFYQVVIEAGGQAYILFPVVPVPEENADTYQMALYESMQEELAIPVLGQPTPYLFALDEFFDGRYHLDAEGRERRMALMIDDLNPVLAKSDSVDE